jgi:hypothetical protein
MERGTRVEGEHKDYFHLHPIETQRKERLIPKLRSEKLVVTARHPHRTFLSHLVRSGQRALQDRVITKLTRIYDIFFEDLEKNKNHTILTLDGDPQLRERNLLDIASFLDVDLDLYEDNIVKYAKEWERFHYFRKPDVDGNPLLAEYDANPDMINEFKMEGLQYAIDWYERVRIK